MSTLVKTSETISVFSIFSKVAFNQTGYMKLFDTNYQSPKQENKRLFLRASKMQLAYYTYINVIIN